MAANVSTNTIAVLLILALVFAGVGVGIAINNYQNVNAAAFKDVNTVAPQPVANPGQVGISVYNSEEEGVPNG